MATVKHSNPLIDMIWTATLELLDKATCTNEAFNTWYSSPAFELPHVEGATCIDELIRRGVVRGWSATEIAQEIIDKRETAFVQTWTGI